MADGGRRRYLASHTCTLHVCYRFCACLLHSGPLGRLLHPLRSCDLSLLFLELLMLQGVHVLRA